MTDIFRSNVVPVIGMKGDKVVVSIDELVTFTCSPAAARIIAEQLAKVADLLEPRPSSEEM